MIDKQFDKETFKKSVKDNVKFLYRRKLEEATQEQLFQAVSYTVKDVIIDNWLDTQNAYEAQDPKIVYYMSMEFLMGRALGNNLLNLGAYGEVKEALEELGIDINALEDQEPDPALGNGGLGRLAACFLDSLATLGYSAYGCGIRYRYGMFKQEIRDGYQVEVPDAWLEEGYPFELRRPEVCFLMDRFGYMRVIDRNAYERNKEAAHAENKFVFTCMNTDKICIFTDMGRMHSIKVVDIPLVRFRDKGTPVDNLSNYDSTQEQILYVVPVGQVKLSSLLFVTKTSMCKLVAGSEFDVSKRTIASTKLGEEDALIFVGPADEMEQIVFQSQGGYFLRILKNDVSAMKKTSVGVRGMKLAEGDVLEHAYLIEPRQEYTITYHDKPYSLNKVKLAKRDTKGTKPRI